MADSDRLQAKGFRFCFTPLFGVLFTFPSRYWFTIGLSGVFSLARWCWQIHAGFLRSRATQDTRYDGKSFRVRGCHPLRPNFPVGSTKILNQNCKSYNPDAASTTSVWANPRSLATTCGITIVFSSCGYLDVSVPRVRLRLTTDIAA